MEVLFGALLRGCTLSLQVLQLEGNRFGSVADQTGGSFEVFFRSAQALREIHLASTRMPFTFLSALCTGLQQNTALEFASVYLNLASNEFGHKEALLLSASLHAMTCLRHLDLDENGFEGDEGVCRLFDALRAHQSLERLSLAKCLQKTSLAGGGGPGAGGSTGSSSLSPRKLQAATKSSSALGQQPQSPNGKVPDLKVLLTLPRLQALNLSSNGLKSGLFDFLRALQYSNPASSTAAGEDESYGISMGFRYPPVSPIQLDESLPAVSVQTVAAPLAYLDISSNALGDRGALQIAKSLRFPTLRDVLVHDNGFGVGGWTILKTALGRNRNVVGMVLPSSEFAGLDKSSGGGVGARGDQCMRDLMGCLMRNASGNTTGGAGGGGAAGLKSEGYGSPPTALSPRGIMMGSSMSHLPTTNGSSHAIGLMGSTGMGLNSTSAVTSDQATEIGLSLAQREMLDRQMVSLKRAIRQLEEKGTAAKHAASSHHQMSDVLKRADGVLADLSGYATLLDQLGIAAESADGDRNADLQAHLKTLSENLAASFAKMYAQVSRGSVEKVAKAMPAVLSVKEGGSKKAKEQLDRLIQVPSSSTPPPSHSITAVPYSKMEKEALLRMLTHYLEQELETRSWEVMKRMLGIVKNYTYEMGLVAVESVLREVEACSKGMGLASGAGNAAGGGGQGASPVKKPELPPRTGHLGVDADKPTSSLSSLSDADPIVQPSVSKEKDEPEQQPSQQVDMNIQVTSPPLTHLVKDRLNVKPHWRRPSRTATSDAEAESVASNPTGGRGTVDDEGSAPKPPVRTKSQRHANAGTSQDEHDQDRGKSLSPDRPVPPPRSSGPAPANTVEDQQVAVDVAVPMPISPDRPRDVRNELNALLALPPRDPSSSTPVPQQQPEESPVAVSSTPEPTSKPVPQSETSIPANPVAVSQPSTESVEEATESPKSKKKKRPMSMSFGAMFGKRDKSKKDSISSQQPQQTSTEDLTLATHVEKEAEMSTSAVVSGPTVPTRTSSPEKRVESPVSKNEDAVSDPSVVAVEDHVEKVVEEPVETAQQAAARRAAKFGVGLPFAGASMMPTPGSVKLRPVSMMATSPSSAARSVEKSHDAPMPALPKRHAEQPTVAVASEPKEVKPALHSRNGPTTPTISIPKPSRGDSPTRGQSESPKKEVPTPLIQHQPAPKESDEEPRSEIEIPQIRARIAGHALDGTGDFATKQKEYMDWLKSKSVPLTNDSASSITGYVSDGVSLLELIEALNAPSGTPMPKYRKKATLSVHKIDNMNILLNHLRDKLGIQTGNVTAEGKYLPFSNRFWHANTVLDLINGEPKKIMVLMNAILKQFP